MKIPATRLAVDITLSVVIKFSVVVIVVVRIFVIFRRGLCDSHAQLVCRLCPFVHGLVVRQMFDRLMLRLP